jgi:hypothetical protein
MAEQTSRSRESETREAIFVECSVVGGCRPAIHRLPNGPDTHNLLHILNHL